MTIVSPPELKCKKCFTINVPNVDEFEDPSTSSSERNMGEEREFTWELEMECSKCKSPLSITISGWEYPVGILNYQETKATGCLVSKDPVLNVVFDDEDSY